jgi:hypothetical protein
VLNLPSRVEKTATPEEEFAGFDYTFGGEKIRKAASGGAGTTERLYLGGAEFVDGEAESLSNYEYIKAPFTFFCSPPIIWDNRL